MLLFIIGFSMVMASLAHGNSPRPSIGLLAESESGPQYHLLFNFGLEQWEKGEPAENLKQHWLLNCDSPESASTRCTLERTDYWVFEGELIVSTRRFDSVQENLKIIRINWDRGILDFKLIHKDHTTTDVKIRMAYKDKVIYLDSFQAFTIARGLLSDSLTPIEFRIPQYTYTWNVPIKMRGFRSEGEKKMNDLLSTLSQQDQEGWEKFKTEESKNCEFFTIRKTQTEDQILSTIIPNWENRKSELEKTGKLTAAENELLEEYITKQFGECLKRSNISVGGREKILKVWSENLQ